MKRFLRRSAWVLLTMIVVAAALFTGSLLYLTTDSARNQLVSFAARRIGPRLGGQLRVGSSEGDLTRGMVLHDVVIDDLDGRLAVYVERLELRYASLAVLIGRVQVDSLSARGVTVVSRPLRDGRDNLAALKRPGSWPERLPVSILLADVDVRGRFLRLPADVPLERASPESEVRGHLHGRADLSQAMTASIDALTLDLEAPSHAHLSAHGRVHLATTPVVGHAYVKIDGDPRSLRGRLAPMPLSGPAVLIAQADGPVDDLRGSLSVTTTSPRLRAHASAHLFGDRVHLSSMSVVAPFAELEASGTYRFDRTGHGKLHARISDLGALAAFGAPPLAGSVTLDAEGKHDAAHTTLEAKGLGVDLRVAGDRARRILFDIDTADLRGHALVRADRLLLGAVRLREAKVELDGTTSEVRLSATAHGPEGIDLELAATAAPRRFEEHLLGVEATLQRLHLRAGGAAWDMVRPAHLSADLATNMYSLGLFELANAEQRVRVEGRMMGRTIEGVFVDVKHFDLRDLASVLSPGHVLAHTDLSAQLEAHGPIEQPEISGSFSGEADGKSERDFIHVTANGEARWAMGRIGGKVFATIGGQKVSAKVDMPLPLQPDQPIGISFDASVLLSPWFADQIVPKLIQSQPIVLYSLGARVTAQGSISGTTSAPRINASARLARWDADSAHGDVGVSIEYKDKQLGASATLTLSRRAQGGGSGGGLVEATAMLPIDLGAILSGRGGRLLDPDAPWHGALRLKHVGVEHLPFEAFAIVPPIQHGWVDGAVDVAGSKNHPTATAQIDGRGLDLHGVTGIDVTGGAQLAGRALRADLRVSVRGSEAFHLHGDLGSEPGGELAWRRTPINVALETKGFDLGRLGIIERLSGSLNSLITISGTFERPVARCELGASILQLGATKYDSFVATGSFRDRVVAGQLLAVQPSGARLSMAARVPLDGGAVAGELRATHFSVDIASELLSELRRAKGEVDGTLQLSGSSAAPALSGQLTIRHGELGIASSAIAYRDVAAELLFTPNAVAVRSLAFCMGTEGTASGAGSLRLERLHLHELRGRLAVHHYPVERLGVAALVDADVAIAGGRTVDGAFVTRLKLERGAARLADDRGKGLLPMAKLADVQIVGSRSQPVMNLAGQRSKPRGAVWLTLSLEGPLVLRGGELDMTVRGDLVVEVGSEVPNAHGTLSIDPGGALSLFGHRYQILRGRMHFVGAEDASLDLRLWRQASSARIGVDVAGSEQAPLVRFWSDPPAYDGAQVAAMVLGQEPSVKEVDTVHLLLSAPGPVSELVARAVGQSLLSRLRGDRAHLGVAEGAGRAPRP